MLRGWHHAFTKKMQKRKRNFLSVKNGRCPSFLKFKTGISLGTSLKGLQEKIEKESAPGFAADAGVLYELPIKNKILAIGMTARNFGTKMQFINENYELPSSVDLGIGYEWKSLLMGLDVWLPMHSIASVHIGGEYSYRDLVTLRVGYKTNTIESLNAFAGLCLGAGFGWKNYRIDYAFVPYAELGNTHRVSLGIRFGRKTSWKIRKTRDTSPIFYTKK